MTLAPTPYADVNALLERLQREIQAEMGERCVGMYLRGSLASGGFAPERSDIDVLVLTAGKLPEASLPRFASLHARLADGGGPWAARLECSYVPAAAIRRHDPQHPISYPTLRQGESLRLDELGSEWVLERHVLREWGITLEGPAARDLIDPVSAEELRDAVKDLLDGWWLPQARDPERLREPGYRAYAVLTMCRAAYTLDRGELVPKPDAADWALARLSPRWSALIEWARDWPRSRDGDNLPEARALIRRVAEDSRPESG